MFFKIFEYWKDNHEHFLHFTFVPILLNIVLLFCISFICVVLTHIDINSVYSNTKHNFKNNCNKWLESLLLLKLHSY